MVLLQRLARGLYSSYRAWNGCFSFAVRDHALMLECICGAICLVICETNYGKMKRMGKQMQDAGDDEYHELQYRIEVSSSWGMIASTVGTVLMMLIIHQDIL